MGKAPHSGASLPVTRVRTYLVHRGSTRSNANGNNIRSGNTVLYWFKSVLFSIEATFKVAVKGFLRVFFGNLTKPVTVYIRILTLGSDQKTIPGRLFRVSSRRFGTFRSYRPSLS